jgi:peptidoglycan hydrolase-like protein with peptidoglycan-binding domain
MNRRRTWIALGTAAALLIAGGVAALAVTTADADTPDDDGHQIDAAFYTVERQDLADVTTSPGTLDYADQHPLTSGLGGTLTGLPGLGEVIDRGGVLYRVDNTPVVLMIGGLPAWRSFDVSMSNGPDVTQLETNLRDLGFFDQEPNERFDWVTREAVRDWQESLGMPRTGQVELGRIVFEPAARRVGAVNKILGDRIGSGGEALTLTSQERTVTVELPIADQRLAEIEGPVTIRIPGGTETPGKIASLGSPTEVPNGTDTKLVIPVEITLDDPAAAGDVQRISVSVSFQKAVYEDVLAVPVTALIALPGGGLGVEKKDGEDITRISVETGAFVQGFVEIVSGDLQEGDQVVVPE